jgi:hypothetical protein
MMLLTGLPELSSSQDLAYLRDTLVRFFLRERCYTELIFSFSSMQALDLTTENALELFRVKFEEALKNSWTSFNWFIHMLHRNNN